MSSTIQYNIIGDGEQQFITCFVPGHGLLTAGNDHPNFERILENLLVGPPSEGTTPEYEEAIIGLFDLSIAIATQFEALSERVSVAHGKVYFDGDEVNSVLTDHIIRAYNEGADFTGLVNFYEKLAANPLEHSREQAYLWLSRRNFTITPEGDIVAYKGVRESVTIDGEQEFVSLNAARPGQPAVKVNGQEVEGQVPQKVGDIVEMPRTAVAHDPRAACSTGLHVGTFDYASTYGDILLKVLVNPRDIVSVPTSDSGDKVRVCRYRILEVAKQEDTSAVASFPSVNPEDEEEYERCDCGERYEDCCAPWCDDE